MKPETINFLKRGLIPVPFCVCIGIAVGLLFGIVAGMLACGILTLIICDYILSNTLIENEVSVIVNALLLSNS